MVEYNYKKAKNANINHISFELNYGYYSRVFYKKDVDPHSKSKYVDKLATKIKMLMFVYKEILHHAQELWKRAYDKLIVKLESYTLGDKIWLNNNYIKNKQNEKFKTKFFRPLFSRLHLVGEDVYKLKLSKR